VEPKHSFSFNGTIFSTQRAFIEAFPAYKHYVQEAKRGDVTTITEIEQLIARRAGNHATAARKQGARNRIVARGNRFRGK
jgi:hypothetical protein